MSYLTINHRRQHLSPVLLAFLITLPLTSQAAFLPFSVTDPGQSASGCHSNSINLNRQGQLAPVGEQSTCVNQQGKRIDISKCQYTGLTMLSNGHPTLRTGQRSCIQSKSTAPVTGQSISVDLAFLGDYNKSGCKSTGIKITQSGKVVVDGFNNCVNDIQSLGGDGTLAFNSTQSSVNCTFKSLTMDAQGKITITANDSCRKSPPPPPTGSQPSEQLVSHTSIGLPGTEGFTTDQHIILTGVPSQVGSQPGVIQLTKETDPQGNVKAHFTEWGYLDQQHLNEKFDYAIFEKGCHSLASQAKFIVGSFDLDLSGNSSVYESNWKTITPQCASSKITSVFMTIQPYQGKPLIVRARGLSNNNFQASLFQDKARTREKSQRNGSFTVGYIAFYGDPDGTINMNDEQISISVNTLKVDDKWIEVEGFDPTQHIRLQEDKNPNPPDKYRLETKHKLETVKVLNLGNKLFAQDIAFSGKQPFVFRRK